MSLEEQRHTLASLKGLHSDYDGYYYYSESEVKEAVRMLKERNSNQRKWIDEMVKHKSKDELVKMLYDTLDSFDKEITELFGL